MILLDTNVLSELMRPAPNLSVIKWLRIQSATDLGSTTISIAEIRYGLARLPRSHRRTDLERRFAEFLVRGLENRIFDFDNVAADHYGEMAVERERSGRRLEGFDGLIAAIARSRNAAVATRNIADFAGCGIELINPWVHA